MVLWILQVSIEDAYRYYRGIAQLVEQRSPKPRAEGSSPSAPAIKETSFVCYGKRGFLLNIRAKRRETERR